MGSPRMSRGGRITRNERIVRIRPFDLGMTEVTIGQFRAFLDGRPDLHERYSKQMELDPSLPLTDVCWYDAVAYCNWLSEREGLPPRRVVLSAQRRREVCGGDEDRARTSSPGRGYRLPLESEWEYACRAGTTTARSFGDTDGLLSRYACYLVNSSDRPFPVGSLLPNAFGLFDMHGNVFEWCQDRYGRRSSRRFRGGRGQQLRRPPGPRVRLYDPPAARPIGRSLQGSAGVPQQSGGIPPGPEPADHRSLRPGRPTVTPTPPAAYPVPTRGSWRRAADPGGLTSSMTTSTSSETGPGPLRISRLRKASWRCGENPSCSRSSMTTSTSSMKGRGLLRSPPTNRSWRSRANPNCSTSSKKTISRNSRANPTVLRENPSPGRLPMTRPGSSPTPTTSTMGGNRRDSCSALYE